MKGELCSRSLAACLLVGVASPALYAQDAAQPAPPQQPEHQGNSGSAPVGGEDDEDIVVTGQRQRGSVIGDIQPELTLNAGDVRAYGVSSISDLLSELGPQIRSDQGSGGAPVVLLNGRRISGFAEIRDLPTEAIQRVEILPEEVALKYGYAPDQKVVNIVLRRRFRAVTAEANGSTTTEGGGGSGGGDAGIFHIRNDSRLQLTVKYGQTASLRESQRNLVSRPIDAPYDFAGNIGAGPNSATGEVDPALSALVGYPVTVAGVPVSAATSAPTLGAFAATANDPNGTDLTRYRTLQPSSQNFSVNTVLTRPVSGSVTATVNASFGLTSSDALNGLPGAALALPAGSPFSPFTTDTTLYRYPAGLMPLSQSVEGQTGHLGVTLNGMVSSWQWTLTGAYDYAASRTITQRGLDTTAMQSLLDANDPDFNPFAALPLGLIDALPADRARSTSNSGDVTLTASGSLVRLPAGDISTTIKVSGDALGLDSRSFRAGVATAGAVSRQTGAGQINFDLPVASRRKGFLSVLGELTVNGNAAVQQLSDFGTLTTYGYGLNWRPVTPLSFIVSVTDTDGAPTVNQLGDPTVITPGVRVFDYVRGATVDVTQVTGGNPDLLASNRHVMKLGLNYKPFARTDLTLTANFIKTRVRNQSTSLPAATAAIEAAFPDRFIRDEDGDLVRVDSRAVNFARASSSELRWGFNFSKPIKTSQKVVDAMRDFFRQRREAMQGAGGPPPGAGGPPPGEGGGQGGAGAGGGRGPGGGPGGGPFGGGGRGGGAGGRLQFSLYHTWHFTDEVLIRDGLPVIDLLNGGTIGARGGQSRHELEAVGGYSKNGWGLRFTGNWQSATTVRDGRSTGDLRFSDLATANLRFFINLGQVPSLVRKPWAQGTRVMLSVNNLLDTRMKVRDATGAIPISYQPAYLDPLGRTIKLSIRKLFF
ncbi:MAG: TonB-dependent receptor [Sphingomonas sanxanigenens]|uniref:TonB-dependent receptor n=1 Tax=Sphingomonas sanxanigenens TaxID=397260 RepID=A0A2W5A122_9SPHN|nr:MAG: TonB-dependent receptor [Sphingomonas sanxanigenens]